MSNETNLTIKGRLTADPESRFTPSGSAVTNFTVAVSASKFDKNSPPSFGGAPHGTRAS